MKIHLDKTGAKPVAADFDMLRASLLAAQSSGPTVQASVWAHRLPSTDEALARLFGGRADADTIAALGSSFSPAVARLDPGDEG